MSRLGTTYYIVESLKDYEISCSVPGQRLIQCGSEVLHDGTDSRNFKCLIVGSVFLPTQLFNR